MRTNYGLHTFQIRTRSGRSHTTIKGATTRPNDLYRRSHDDPWPQSYPSALHISRHRSSGGTLYRRLLRRLITTMRGCCNTQPFAVRSHLASSRRRLACPHIDGCRHSRWVGAAIELSRSATYIWGCSEHSTPYSSHRAIHVEIYLARPRPALTRIWTCAVITDINDLAATRERIGEKSRSVTRQW